ncbi:MAG: DUF4150 domain-containing protein [Acidobacteria bacterium]|nr:DUF4150 domain-containing protein [Acidobacteriota bacterium]
MANEVYANGMEVACKAADGKSVCAFPDVCFTPPQTPATPPGVPIPYPNTGFARDTTEGSKNVKISGKEVMQKNKSYFKKSTGDEAGSAPKKGILTSQNTGKVYFNAWSMDVKVEGQNVVRNLDLTTHNHASFPGDTPVWPYLDKASVDAGTGPCADEMKREKEACKDYKPNKTDGRDVCADAGLTKKLGRAFDVEFQTSLGTVQNRAEVLASADRAEAEACLRARRCQLQQYDKDKTGCCPGQTPHHLVEASALFETGRGPKNKGDAVDGFGPLAALKRGEPAYNEHRAPCVCAEGVTNTVGTHGFMHTLQSSMNAAAPEEELDFFLDGKVQKRKVKAQTYAQAKENANRAMMKTFPLSFCSPACINAQLDNYHNQCGIDDNTKIKAVTCGSTETANVEFAERNSLDRAMRESPAFDLKSETGYGPPDLPDFGIGGGWIPVR